MKNGTPRPKFGHVYQLPLSQTKKGYAYLQYINRHTSPPRFGPVIRVFRGIFEHPVLDVKQLDSLEDQFVTFFHVPAAFKRQMISFVGALPIPDQFLRSPMFKSYLDHARTGERQWWITDGLHTERVSVLKPEHYDLPILEIIDSLVLEERIVSGWTARDEVR